MGEWGTISSQNSNYVDRDASLGRKIAALKMTSTHPRALNKFLERGRSHMTPSLFCHFLPPFPRNHVYICRLCKNYTSVIIWKPLPPLHDYVIYELPQTKNNEKIQP